MRKNELYKKDGMILRVLEVHEEKALVMDCVKRTVPHWLPSSELSGYFPCDETDLCEATGIPSTDLDSLSPESQKLAREKYTLICGILPFIGDDTQRNAMIRATCRAGLSPLLTIPWMSRRSGWWKRDNIPPLTS